MSPFSTFQSCGNSSSEHFRRKEPIGVIRGSSLSFWVSSHSRRASIDYRYAINGISDLGFSANVAELDQAGGPAVNDTTRADLRATYSREITPDWRLSSGYEFRWRDEENVGSATSNRVFLTLEREFVLRP